MTEAGAPRNISESSLLSFSSDKSSREGEGRSLSCNYQKGKLQEEMEDTTSLPRMHPA